MQPFLCKAERQKPENGSRQKEYMTDKDQLNDLNTQSEHQPKDQIAEETSAAEAAEAEAAETDQAPSPAEDAEEPKVRFSELPLSDDVQRAVADAGYEHPTPIQAEAIPEVLGGRDILGIAQTGTGKTASFTLPMIDKLARGRAKARMPRSLILEPTRELAMQVAENFDTYGKYNKLTKALLIGGVAFGDQDRLIDRGVDVLIATPGRLLDHVERGKLMLMGVETLVVDEADRMLDMGFIPDVERICSLIPPARRQMLFFSATMPPEITKLSNRFLNDPKRIEVARPATTADTITSKLVKVAPRAKRRVLRELLKSQDIQNAIIFCNRKRDVTELQRSLERHDFDAKALHGDIPQNLRMETLEAFRNGEVKILVASDVAARGLDIPEVSHVFNFDVPHHAEDYVHRIGRTGRAGREGHAFMLQADMEEKSLKAIEDLIGKKIEVIDLGLPKEEPKSRDNNRRDGQRNGRGGGRNNRNNSRGNSGGNNKGSSNRGRGRLGRGSWDDNIDESEIVTLPDDMPKKPFTGFGPHVPAFMLNEVDVKSRRRKPANSDTPEAQPESGQDAEAA